MEPVESQLTTPLTKFAAIAELARAIIRKAKNLNPDEKVDLPGDKNEGKYIAVALNRHGQLSIGRAQFSGKRRNPHWNKRKLTVNSRAHDIVNQSVRVLEIVRAAEGKEITAADMHAIITRAGKLAMRGEWATQRENKRLKRAMRDASNRVRRGTISGNSHAARVAHTASYF